MHAFIDKRSQLALSGPHRAAPASVMSPPSTTQHTWWQTRTHTVIDVKHAPLSQRLGDVLPPFSSDLAVASFDPDRVWLQLQLRP